MVQPEVLSGLYGQHDGQAILDYGCGPGNDVIGFATQVHRLTEAPRRGVPEKAVGADDETASNLVRPDWQWASGPGAEQRLR